MQRSRGRICSAHVVAYAPLTLSHACLCVCAAPRHRSTLTKPGGPKQPVGILSKGAAAGQPGSGQRINWGAPNKVGHFTRGSSPREFGNKMRHDQMRSESLGSAPQAQQQSAPAPQRV